MKIINHLVLFTFVLLSVFSCSKKKDDPAVIVPDVPIVPAIGVSYAGGIIFYLDSTGQHGYVAALSDQPVGATWGCKGTLISANGNGYYNTNAILSNCSTADIAARVCHTMSSGGFTDWFLPSKEQLDMMHANIRTTGRFAVSYYWSSTEADNNNAWFQYFDSNGVQGVYSKDQPFYVRAARSF